MSMLKVNFRVAPTHRLSYRKEKYVFFACSLEQPYFFILIFLSFRGLYVLYPLRKLKLIEQFFFGKIFFFAFFHFFFGFYGRVPFQSCIRV